MIEGTTASLNSYTSSTNTRLGVIETATSSLNSFTSSINTTIKNRLNAENVVSGSGQIDITQTTNYTTFSSSLATTDLNQSNKLSAIESTTASLNTFTSSANSRLNSLESTTSSLNSYTSSTNTRLGVIESTTSSLNTFTSSTNTRFGVIESTTSSLNSYTSSTNTRLSVIESTTGSLNTFTSSANGRLNLIESSTSSLNSYTSSNNTRLGVIESTTSSLNTYTASNNTRLGVIESTTASLNTFTSSANGRLNALETASGSIRTDFNTFTSSYTTVSGSLDSRLDVLEAYSSSQQVPTASYAFRTTRTDVFCQNNSGYQINKGQVVRIVGAAGDNPLIATASYINDNNSANTLGIATENIANGANGLVITEGVLLGVNTLGMTAGDLIFLGATGSFINTAPIAPLHAVRLGEVLRVNQNNGSLYVRIDNGIELDEAHDVVYTNISQGDLLVRNSGGVWSNSKSLNGDYSLTGSLNISGSQNIIGNQTITGSLYITQDLIIAGSSSIQHISSSVVNIADNIITVNTQNPGIRFGGLAVIDSGSSPQVSGSILFDSAKDQWLFVHQNQGTITSSVVLMGPESFNNLGGETYLTLNRIPKGSGIEHLYDSNITDSGTKVSINSNTEVTGTFIATGTIYGTNITAIEATTSSLNSYTSSNNTTNNTQNSRLTSLESSTSSLNTFTSSTSGRLTSIETSTGSLNTFTSSAGTRLNSIETSTGSLNTFTSSTNNRLSSIETSTSSLNSYTSSTNTRLGSIETSTGSLNSYTSSTNTRLNSIETSTGSLNSYTSSTNTRLSNIETSTGSLNSFTSSTNTRLNSIETSTGSLNSYTSSTNTRLSSIETSTGSLNSYTASNNTTNTAQNNRLSALETSTGSLNSFTSSTNTRLSAIETSTSSLNSYTASNDSTNTTQNSRLSAIETSTGSLNSFTSSANTRLGLIETSTGSLNTFTSSINTTIKNRLNAEGVISGSAQVVSALPSGTVSGSVQVSIASTSGFSTYLDQPVKSGSTVTFNFVNTNRLSQTSHSTALSNGSYAAEAAVYANAGTAANAFPGYGFHKSGELGVFLYATNRTTLRMRGDDGSDNLIYHSGNLTNLNQLTNGPGYITSAANWFGAESTSGTLDWNHVTNTRPGTGATLLLGNATNGFSVGDYYHSFNLEYSSKNGQGNVTQLAISYGTPGNDIRMRGRYDGTWSSWVRILNSSNFNSFAMSGAGYSANQNLNTTSAVTFAGVTSTAQITAGYSVTTEPFVNAHFYNTSTATSTQYGGLLVSGINQAHVRFQVGSNTWGAAGAKQWQIRVGNGNGSDDMRVYSWTYGGDVMTYNSNGTVSVASTLSSVGLTNTGAYSGSGGSFSHNVGNPSSTTELFVHNGANTPVPFRMTKAGYTGAGGSYGILQLYMNDNTNGNGANLYFCANNSSSAFYEYGGVGMQIKSNTAGSETARLYFYRQNRAVNGTFDSDGTLYTVGNIYTNGNGTTTGNLVLNSSNYTSYALTNNNDSEQIVGLREVYWNNGSNRVYTDPRWNESGYDGDLGTLHIYSTTAAGANYGRAGIALYNGSAYQYITTRSGQSQIYINNNVALHAGNFTSYAMSGAGYSANQNLNTNNTPTFAGVKGSSYFDAQASSGFRIRNSNDSANVGGWTRRGLWEGNSNYDPALWAETGYSLYIYTNGSATIRAYWDTSGHLLPGQNNTYDLGSSSLGWRNVYTNDLHLSNMNKPEGNDVDGTNGNWTIQEGAENLYIINNNNGKKFKISLEEIK